MAGWLDGWFNILVSGKVDVSMHLLVHGRVGECLNRCVDEWLDIY